MSAWAAMTDARVRGGQVDGSAILNGGGPGRRYRVAESAGMGVWPARG